MVVTSYSVFVLLFERDFANSKASNAKDLYVLEFEKLYHKLYLLWFMCWICYLRPSWSQGKHISNQKNDTMMIWWSHGGDVNQIKPNKIKVNIYGLLQPRGIYPHKCINTVMIYPLARKKKDYVVSLPYELGMNLNFLIGSSSSPENDLLLSCLISLLPWKWSSHTHTSGFA